MIWKIRDRILSINRTLIMGILNLTPDSFSEGGAYREPQKAVERAAQLIEEGADILDLGAESSRPGAEEISAEEELARLLPVLKEILRRFNIPISIDTTKAPVAASCLLEGAHIINDVSGLRQSGPALAETVHQFKAGLILMHRRGNARTMMELAQYEDVSAEVFAELKESLERALAQGISRDHIVLDPGLGFSKTTQHNLQILRELERFLVFKRPILMGPSRKRFLGDITGRPVQDREFATAACATAAVFKGVSILRVHEVGAMRDAIQVAEALRGENYVGTF
ncbi:MAG: dihydropteroate synthase [Candidatus Omnitrophica bacterium]|nr:dihydropteroate synthase [Candidatus Omnitrophota bacterium]